MKDFLKLGFATICLNLFTAGTGYCEHRAEMQAAFLTQSGFSDWYLLTIDFASGQELNSATNSFNFKILENYAVIWFNKENVAILEIDSALSFGSHEFEERQWNAIFGSFVEVEATQVNSDPPRKWILKRPLLRRSR